MEDQARCGTTLEPGHPEAIDHKLARHALRHSRHHDLPIEQVDVEALIASGKEKKVALTAITRKIIVMANALVRDDRQWAATRA